MKFVLDHCVAKPILNFLGAYEVHRAGQLGWDRLSNGKLLAAAESAGYCALITVDKGFAAQQNMAGRQIAVLLLDTLDTSIDGLEPLVPRLVRAMEAVAPGSFVRIGGDGT